MKSEKKKAEKAKKPLYSERFTKAFAYAARLHARQTRKGTNKPYIGHLMSVASIVIAYGGDEEMAIAALLHDVVEDAGGEKRLREIRNKFGKRVARIVDGCTDTYKDPKPPWLQRKKDYIARVAGEAEDTRKVSAADKLSNVRDILEDVRAGGVKAFERFTGKKEGTLWYYRTLVQVFREAGTNPLVEELDRVVTELEKAANSGTSDTL
ncbi:MAG TPA: HD domain-containing protein [Methylomirabilota bacterium]|nr:HD domain-containing protein [Methylomirabilota bacterium]